VPLTAFLNRRSLLAFFALLIGFILVTFVLPFFALIRNRSSYEVSIQMTIVFAVFFLASIFGSYLMRCLGPKRITTLSLILATGACFLLGIESSDHDEGTQKIAKSDSGMQRIFDTIMMFADNAIAGYLLIVIAIALLTMASLEEVLSGTENKLLRTKFVNASNLHLFVESIFMVYSVMQLAHIIGPIVGGLINTELGMVQTCQVMGQIGAIAVFLYLVLGLWVHCTLHEENTLSLEDIEIDELDPEVRFATAQSPHALRSSMRLSTHNAGASAFTISQNRDRVREPQNRQQVRFAPHHTQTSPQRDSVLTEMKKE